MIRQWVQKIFAQQQPIEKPADLPAGEIGYDSTALYDVGRDFPKYNPDTLITKKGKDIYRKMMLDDQVKAVMQFKQKAVAGRDWYFDIDEEIPAHQEMADFFSYAIHKIRGSFTDHLVGILSGLPQGFSITEKVFAPVAWNGRTMWGVADLKLRPADTFWQGFEVDVHGNVLKLVQSQGAQRVEIPMEKIIHFVHQPDIDRHYGESDLRACYRSWWSKDIAIKFQNIFMERGASGFVWAKVTGTQTATNRNRLKNLMNNISARMSAIVPGNVDLKVEQPRQTTAFRDAVAQHDKAIAKALLTPNLLGLSEQGDTGSYSQSETQFKVFLWILDEIARRLEEALNEQMFAQLARWNFGTEDFPRFCFEAISDAEKMSLAERWASLLRDGAVEKSEADEAWIRRLIGAPEKPEEEKDDDPEDDDAGPEDDDGGEVPGDGEQVEPPPEPDNEPFVAAKEAEAQAAIRAAFAERPWLRRVNFTAIESHLDETDDQFMADLAAVMGKVKKSMEQQIVRIVGQRSLGNVAPKELEQISVPKSLVTEYRRVVRAHLQRVLEESYRQARAELPAKKNEAIRPGMDLTQAEKFLASKAMRIGGVMEQAVLKAVQQVLENAIRYDRSLRQVMQAMAQDTDLLAWLPETDRAGRPVNIPNRLENIARTNTADAMNTARTALFSDPDLDGFIRAFEYSAILDGRTSPICEHLHGRIRRVWNEYTPPNHFFCRSLLVPVTVIDDWNGQESPAPTMQPNKGFY